MTPRQSQNELSLVLFPPMDQNKGRGGGGRVSALDQKLVHLHRPDRAAAELEGGVDRNKYNLQYAFKNQIGQ